ncbi:MAG: SURF1 family protein [Paracoccaceae bacterium]|nr:SURF1 family protein [Paracoccaceae bacterium]
MVFPLVLGVSGTLALIALGNWQLDRLEWKTGLLDAIDVRMRQAAADLPKFPDPEAHAFFRVRVEGVTDGRELHVLTSDKWLGPGYRILVPLETEDGPILADLGFVPEAEKGRSRPPATLRIDGNLQWPRETDRLFTPDPDRAGNIWFARDVEVQAAELGTRPVLVVASRIDRLDGGVPAPFAETQPVPVTANIPNDHLEYAITWFALAAVWAAMSTWLVVRVARGTA